MSCWKRRLKLEMLLKPDSKHTSVTALSPSANSSHDLLMRSRLTKTPAICPRSAGRPVAAFSTKSLLPLQGSRPVWYINVEIVAGVGVKSWTCSG